MLIKKTYQDFIEIVGSRKLEIQISSERADQIHLLAKDGIVFYECYVNKNSSDAADFNAQHLASSKNKFTDTEPQIQWDEMTTTFPATNQDLFTYKFNTVPVQTVLVTYESSAKKQIMSVKKTRV